MSSGRVIGSAELGEQGHVMNIAQNILLFTSDSAPYATHRCMTLRHVGAESLYITGDSQNPDSVFEMSQSHKPATQIQWFCVASGAESHVRDQCTTV